MKRSFTFFALVTLGLLSYAFYQAMFAAPTEATMGDVQRIFYYHLPHAWVAFLLFFANFLASIWYLVRRTERSDALALASAEVGVVFCTVVLVTGPLVGASGVGHLVDLGCAAHQHARALADLRQLPGVAALRHGCADAGAGGGARLYSDLSTFRSCICRSVISARSIRSR